MDRIYRFLTTNTVATVSYGSFHMKTDNLNKIPWVTISDYPETNHRCSSINIMDKSQFLGLYLEYQWNCSPLNFLSDILIIDNEPFCKVRTHSVHSISKLCIWNLGTRAIFFYRFLKCNQIKCIYCSFSLWWLWNWTKTQIVRKLDPFCTLFFLIIC